MPRFSGLGGESALRLVGATGCRLRTSCVQVADTAQIEGLMGAG